MSVYGILVRNEPEERLPPPRWWVALLRWLRQRVRR
jgi:hypothetical protein